MIETDIPARLDRLPWGRFHSLVVVALGITWALDGLEVTLAGAVAGALKTSPALHFSDAEVGWTGTAYLGGAVMGAVLFGWLTDRLGRRKLFFVTLSVYVAATVATAFSWDFGSFLLFRCLTGAGIGGEYTAINSAIQELVPARVRGWTDLAINGSFWAGAALGAGGSTFLLGVAGSDHGWRLSFLIGGGLGLAILVMRLWIPESPRWLVIRGRTAEAEAVMAGIERRVGSNGGGPVPRLRLSARPSAGIGDIFAVLFRLHRRRALVGLALMAGQAFFYNAIFFTYALVLTDFYAIPAAHVGLYLLPFAVGNFLGPLLLGRLFDTIGRRPMIAFTYIVSGLLLALSGALFQQGVLTASTQTIAWMLIFFFASAAASSAYLTVSETFPLEIRALAIAFFYAAGTALGGLAGPVLFGHLIASGSRNAVFAGYLIGATLMTGAGLVQAVWGVAAERKALEDVARPLSASD